MADPKGFGDFFATVSMAEILLTQNLVEQSRRVLGRLPRHILSDPRVEALRQRLEEIGARVTLDQVPLSAEGRDRINLSFIDRALRLEFELTEEGIALARRKARFAGRNVLRLFTAHMGPRGVRTTTRDVELQHLCARLELLGTPRPAVHVSAVGYLAHTGEFVPLSSSEQLTVDR